MRKLTLAIVVAAFGLMAVGTQTALAGEAAKSGDTAAKEKAGVAAAQDWLKLVDEGKYAESWKQAAEYFRNAVPQEQWVQMVGAVRKPLGKVVSRKLKSATYTTTVPGAPDGQYVIIQFDTSFAAKKTAVETITPMMDKDGRWHVSGYFIK